MAVLAYLFLRAVAAPAIRWITGQSEATWDDILLDGRVLRRFSLLAPLLVVRIAVPEIVELSSTWKDLSIRVTEAAGVVVILWMISALLSAVNRVYTTYEISRQRPIKGYLQVVMIVVWVFGVVVVLARLADQPVGFFLGGIGALTAVLLLVFKDTLLSIVASIQLTNNEMLRLGDWIQIESQGVDGEVIDVALHTVKVQNWDKTISTVPTHALITDPFRNWRGMEESGGRRIKRSILIDMSSIRFMTADEIERWSRFEPLNEYMATKHDELASWNIENAPDGALEADSRRLTNVGTFRAYLIVYLRRHPLLATEEMTFLVRHLAPTPEGLPIQIYVFSSDTRWANYEAIQADIFDHLLAIVPEFGLRVFQNPTGADFRSLRLPADAPPT